MKQLKVGIVGLGSIAHLHARAILESDQALLSGVCSRTKSKAERFAQQYGTRPFTDIYVMIRELGLDFVIICTPHPNHMEPAIKAFKADAHVLVDKPLASSLQDCDAMIEAASQSGKKLGVISQKRWMPATLRVKDAIASGKIGKPVMATVQLYGWRDEAYYKSDAWRGTWELEGGGVLVNQAPHQLDLLLWLMGPIEEVYGITANLNHPYIEVEDTALAIVKFKSGAIGNIILSNSQKPGLYSKVHVHGETGASVGVQTEGGSMLLPGQEEIPDPPVNDIWTVPGEEHLLETFVADDTAHFGKIDPSFHFIQLQIEEFIDALKNQREPISNGVEGRSTVELFTAIYRSNRDKRPVRFPLQAELGRTDYDGRLPN